MAAPVVAAPVVVAPPPAPVLAPPPVPSTLFLTISLPGAPPMPALLLAAPPPFLKAQLASPGGVAATLSCSPAQLCFPTFLGASPGFPLPGAELPDLKAAMREMGSAAGAA